MFIILIIFREIELNNIEIICYTLAIINKAVYEDNNRVEYR